MAPRQVELNVRGLVYRVVTTATEEELAELVGSVEQKLAEVVPAGRSATPHSLFLASLALANDLREERARNEATLARNRAALEALLDRVDGAIAALQLEAAAGSSDEG